MKTKYVFSPPAHIYNSRTTLEDGHWGCFVYEIILEKSIQDDGFDGIDKFSHAEILFYFDKVKDGREFPYSRHPRGNPAWLRTAVLDISRL